MNMRTYYERIRQAEAGIEDIEVVVMSLETPDGGRAGRMTEVTRAVAARMVVDGRARLATAAESAEFRKQAAENHRSALDAAVSNRLQVAVVSDSELRAIKNSIKSPKV